MPRPRGDHEARRREVSEAVWRVLVAAGFAGLTLRAVATELGATTGLVTHYFADKRELVDYALDLLDQRTAQRSRRKAPAGAAALRAALLDLLPLDQDVAVRSRIWVSSWDAALADPAMRAAHAARYAAGRDRLRANVAEAVELGHLKAAEPEDIAAAAQGFVLGLVVQALFDPRAFPPARQRAQLDTYLDTLVTAAGRRAVQG